jgi:hypothetical protein
MSGSEYDSILLAEDDPPRLDCLSRWIAIRRTHYLEGRIALCANCECPRTLSFGSGSLACSRCGSGNSIHPPSNLTTRFHQYRDSEAGTTSRVQPTVAWPKKEEAFCARDVALV